MAVLRAIMIFLVGAGIAIGAHFAGVFDRFSGEPVHPVWRAMDGPPPAGIMVPDRQAAMPPGDMAPGDMAPGAEGPPRAPVVIHVTYFPRFGLDADGSGEGCLPAYELVNRSGRAVLFSGYEGQNGPEQDIRVEPGTSSGLYGQGMVDADADVDAPCRLGLVKVLVDNP